MQIIVKDGEFTFSYDSSVKDTINGGILEEYFPPVDEAVDAAMRLLWNIYDREKIARTLLDGIPAMDYAKAPEE